MKIVLFITLFTLINLTSCEQKEQPEDVLNKWLTHMQNGACEKAFMLEIQPIMYETVELDCLPYIGDVKSIKCKTESEYSDCTCYESRNFAEANVMIIT